MKKTKKPGKKLQNWRGFDKCGCCDGGAEHAFVQRPEGLFARCFSCGAGAAVWVFEGCAHLVSMLLKQHVPPSPPYQGTGRWRDKR